VPDGDVRFGSEADFVDVIAMARFVPPIRHHTFTTSRGKAFAVCMAGFAVYDRKFPDKRPAGDIFLISRLVAHEHKPCVIRAFSKDGLRSWGEQRTAPASAGFRAQLRNRGALNLSRLPPAMSLSAKSGH
jgi:hypothetical protein